MQPVCLGGDTWFDGEWLKLAEWYRNNHQLDRAIAYAERAQECRQPRSVGSNLSWLAELETMRTEELIRAGQREEAAPHVARAERAYRDALRRGYRQGMTQRNLATLYSIADRPAGAVLAFEAAAAAGMLDAASYRRFGAAYVALGRCADARRVLKQFDQLRGLPDLSDEWQTILEPCEGRP
jgi:tetratricopeptide (TPR) repeat protein